MSLRWLSSTEASSLHYGFSVSGTSMCSFSRAWLLVIRRAFYVRTRSRSRTICAGDFRLYPMFIALVGPTSDVIWRGENRILTTTAPDFSSYIFQEFRVSLSNKVSNSIRRLPWASIVGKIQTGTLIRFRKRKKQRSRWAWLSSRTTAIPALEDDLWRLSRPTDNTYYYVDLVLKFTIVGENLALLIAGVPK